MVHLLEEYAKENHIPIMEKEGIEFLLEYIEKNNIKRILEIGTAIGYSAIRMAMLNKEIHVTTIERDENRYRKAIKNIDKFDLKDQITVLFSDAFDLEIDEMYDLLFIDAAKGQYIKFFEKFKHNIQKNGVIVSDNLAFHGLVGTKEPIKSRNVRGIVRKLQNYIDFLEGNKEFKTDFYSVGDGISISKRR